MPLNKFLAIVFSFMLCISLTANANAEKDPVSLLQNVADNMIAGLKANKATLKTKPSIVYNLAYKYIVPYADLTAMSKRVLPKTTWNQASAAERSQFQQEFTRTLIRTYASALTSYQDQTVHFFPVRGGAGTTVVVNGEISSSANPSIQVAYRLIRNQGSWKLYDLSVEGVSMLESFRSQFADILSQGNMAQLLNRMSSHNRRS